MRLFNVLVAGLLLSQNKPSESINIENLGLGKGAGKKWKVNSIQPVDKQMLPRPQIELYGRGGCMTVANRLQVLGTGNDYGGSTVFNATQYTARYPEGRQIALKQIQQCDNETQLNLEIRALKTFRLLAGPVVWDKKTQDVYIPMLFIMGYPLENYFFGRGDTEMSKKIFGRIEEDISIYHIYLKAIKVIVSIHQKGWIHGDLHLGNIILNQDGRLHPIDFGRANKISSTHKDFSEIRFYQFVELMAFTKHLVSMMEDFSCNLPAQLAAVLGYPPTDIDLMNFWDNFSEIQQLESELMEYYLAKKFYR